MNTSLNNQSYHINTPLNNNRGTRNDCRVHHEIRFDVVVNSLRIKAF